MRLDLSRRSLAALLLVASRPPPPSHAVQAERLPPSSCSLQALGSTQQALVAVEQLLSDRDRLAEAKAIIDGVDEAVLQKALEACVDPKAFKDQAMNNAAFIVYYEERRYGDLRLEPQTPSLRAEQNGRKKEL